MEPRFTRGEYWLLETAVDKQFPVSALMANNLEEATCSVYLPFDGNLITFQHDACESRTAAGHRASTSESRCS